MKVSTWGESNERWRTTCHKWWKQNTTLNWGVGAIRDGKNYSMKEHLRAFWAFLWQAGRISFGFRPQWRCWFVHLQSGDGEAYWVYESREGDKVAIERRKADPSNLEISLFILHPKISVALLKIRNVAYTMGSLRLCKFKDSTTYLPHSPIPPLPFSFPFFSSPISWFSHSHMTRKTKKKKNENKIKSYNLFESIRYSLDDFIHEQNTGRFLALNLDNQTANVDSRACRWSYKTVLILEALFTQQAPTLPQYSQAFFLSLIPDYMDMVGGV